MGSSSEINAKTSAVHGDAKQPESEANDDGAASVPFSKPLLPSEEKLLADVRADRMCLLADKIPRDDNPAAPIVTAEFLIELIKRIGRGTEAKPSEIYIRGARIRGDLLLRSVPIVVPLIFRFCRIDLLILNDTKTKLVELDGTWIGELQALRVQVDGNFMLINGTRILGPVILNDAKVDGTLDCIGSRFYGRKRGALLAVNLRVTGSVELSGIRAHGIVSFVAAKIERSFIMDHARLACRGGRAIDLATADIGGNAVFARSAVAGDICLTGCKIGRDLIMNGTVVRAERAYAIHADRMTIGGAAFLRWGFRARGRVRFLGARIEQDFDCEAAIFDAAPPKRLDELPDKFHTDPAWAALNLDGARIGRNVILRKGKFDGSDGKSHTLRFSARGGVVLATAQITLGMLVAEATFQGEERAALNLERTLANTLEFRLVSVRGNLVLQGAKIGHFRDDKESWPESGQIVLDGFQYERLVNPLDAKSRIEWLKFQPDAHLTKHFRPQPWEQLVMVLRAMGNDSGAKEIAIKKRDLFLGSGQIDGWRYGVNQILKWVAEYGYSPHRLVCIILLLWVGFFIVYQQAAEKGIFAPTSSSLLANKDLVSQCRANWTHCDKLPPEYNLFNPLIYALENSLPVVDFGQRKDWAPMTRHADGSLWSQGYAVRCAVWLHIFLGWAGGLLLAGILSGLIKRE